MRWVPAKARLGQAVPMATVQATGQEQFAPATNGGILDKVIYGGLILAGAAAFITFVFGSQD